MATSNGASDSFSSSFRFCHLLSLASTSACYSPLSSHSPSLFCTLSSQAALLLSCLCAPHKTINLLLQNRCALFPFVGASFSLPADDALTHTHIHPYTHIHTHRRRQSALVCIARSRFVGFVIIVGTSLGAMPTRQQAFQLAIWLWRWLWLCPKGLGCCRGLARGALRGG